MVVSAQEARIKLEGAVEQLEADLVFLQKLEQLLEPGWHRRIAWQRGSIDAYAAHEVELDLRLTKVQAYEPFTKLCDAVRQTRARVTKEAREALQSLGEVPAAATLGWLLRRLLERAPIEQGVSGGRAGWLFGVALFGCAAILAFSRTPAALAACVLLVGAGIASWAFAPRVAWKLTSTGVEFGGKAPATFAQMISISMEDQRVIVQLSAQGRAGPDVWELDTPSPARVGALICAHAVASHDAVVCEAEFEDASGVAIVSPAGVVFGPLAALEHLAQVAPLGSIRGLLVAQQGTDLVQAPATKAAPWRLFDAAQCAIRPNGTLRVADKVLTPRWPTEEATRAASWFTPKD